MCAYASEFKVHCGSAFEPGASGLPYYCTSPVCVPDVIGGVAAKQQQKKMCSSYNWSAVSPGGITNQNPKTMPVFKMFVLFSMINGQSAVAICFKFPTKNGVTLKLPSEVAQCL